MSPSDKSASLRERVSEVLTTEIAPALHMDGTDIEVLEVVDGVVRVRLRGACGACPGSVMALIMGIEQELRRHVAEVEYLEAVP
jgi:Fe-S cluster biogenesis protein NfuA